MSEMSETEQATRMTNRVQTMVRLANVLDKPNLSFATNIREMASDSLEFLFQIQAIETAWAVKIPDEEMVKFITARDIVDWLEDNA